MCGRIYMAMWGKLFHSGERTLIFVQIGEEKTWFGSHWRHDDILNVAIYPFNKPTTKQNDIIIPKASLLILSIHRIRPRIVRDKNRKLINVYVIDHFHHGNNRSNTFVRSSVTITNDTFALVFIPVPETFPWFLISS